MSRKWRKISLEVTPFSQYFECLKPSEQGKDERSEPSQLHLLREDIGWNESMDERVWVGLKSHKKSGASEGQ